MSQELTLYQFDASPMEVCKQKGDYSISVWGNAPLMLRRGTDFGMIRRKDGEAMTKYPTLFKSGAEKVAVGYGLCQRYQIESKIEHVGEDGAFFYYSVRCDLVKIVNGMEYVITSAYGSGNTREKRSGTQSPYDGANSALKMAQKRALVSAALSLGCLSDVFTQDIESDTEDADAYFNSKDPNKPISPAQVKFFYAAASRQGYSKTEAKEFLRNHGFDSASKIKTGLFDQIIEDLRGDKNAD